MRSLAVVAIFCLVLATGNASATAQRGDVLILDGEECVIQTHPLEPFFEIHPDRRPESSIVATNLWRGYLATWEIDGDRLLLVDVAVLRRDPAVAHPETGLASVLSDVFPGEERIHATWFTGHLIVPRGEMVEYVHQAYASTFERYTLLTVRRGYVTDRRELSEAAFRLFRHAQFEAYRETAEYGEAFRALWDPDDTVGEIEEFLFRVMSDRYVPLLWDGLPPPEDD